MVPKNQDSKKNCKTMLPEELVTYLDFAIRLRLSYETLQKSKIIH